MVHVAIEILEMLRRSSSVLIRIVGDVATLLIATFEALLTRAAD